MRIAHVTWTFTFGGIETMLVNIVNEQVSLGHEVHVIIIEHDKVEPTLREKLHPSIAFHLVDRKYGVKDVLAMVRLNRMLWQIDADAIHLHGASIFKYLLPRFKKICNSTLHAMCNPANTNYIEKIPRVFSISEIVADDLMEKKGVKAIVNPNGILPELIKTRSVPKMAGTVRVVQVSRLLHETKGQDLLIKAAQKLIERGYSNFELTFIGNGQSLEYLQALSKECLVDDKVCFLGARTQQYIFEHLCDYDLFVQPSRYEGFGLTVAEAMAAKLPVIVSSGQGPEEVVAYGECGYVFENGNAIDLADKIEVFLKGQNDKSMIEKAYERVWNLYNIKVSVRSYLKQYVRRHRTI